LSCFESLNILIDPFTGEQAVASGVLGELNPDVIGVTHGHGGHLGGAADIARRSGCLVISTPEISHSQYLKKLGARAEGMNIVGSFPVGNATFFMTYAQHSSGIMKGDLPAYGGQVSGYYDRGWD